MLLTEEYRELNSQLHDSNDHYGVSSDKWAEIVKEICEIAGTRDILDYGAGKCLLEQSLGWKIRNYDPCIPGIDVRPEPADIVVCTDVLEHIEPECLDSVLDDLRRLIRCKGFFSVCTTRAKKYLADGRNAHLTVRPYQWWLPKIWSRFDIDQFNDLGPEFMVIVRPM